MFCIPYDFVQKVQSIKHTIQYQWYSGKPNVLYWSTNQVFQLLNSIQQHCIPVIENEAHSSMKPLTNLQVFWVKGVPNYPTL